MATGKQKFATISSNNCLCDQPINVGDEIWPIEGMIPAEPSRPARSLWVHVGCARRHFAAGVGEPLVPPPCPYFVKKGWCLHGDRCFYTHPPQTADGEGAPPQPPGHANAKGRKRKNGRRKVANSSKSGTFRRWLHDTYGLGLMSAGAGVLDIAGGSGELAFELVNLNSIPTAIVDPRPLQAKQLAPASHGQAGSLVRRLTWGLFGRNPLFYKYLGPGYEANRADPKVPRHIRLFFDAQLVDWAATLWPGLRPADESSNPAGDTADGRNADDDDGGGGGGGGAETAVAIDSGGGDCGVAGPNARRLGHGGAGDSAAGIAGSAAAAADPAAEDPAGAGSSGGPAEEEDRAPSFVAAALSRALAARSCSIMPRNKLSKRSRSKAPLGPDGTPTESTESAERAERTESGTAVVRGPAEIDTGVRGALGNAIIAVTDDDEVAGLLRGCSMLVGMHPDQATEPMIDFALRFGKPFACIPCCTCSMDFPWRFMDGRLVKSYESFIAYLLRKDDRIQTVDLDFQGKNTVLYMTAAAAAKRGTSATATVSGPTCIAVPR